MKVIKIFSIIIAAIVLILIAILIYPHNKEISINNYEAYALQYYFLNVSNSTILVPSNVASYAKIIAINNNTVLVNNTLYSELFTTDKIPYSGYILLYPDFSQPGIIKFSSQIYVNNSAIHNIFPTLNDCVGANNKSLVLVTCNYVLFNKTLGLISLLINSSTNSSFSTIKSTLVYDYPYGIVNYTFPLVGKRIANYSVLFFNDSSYLIPNDLLHLAYWKLLLSNKYVDDYMLYKVVKV